MTSTLEQPGTLQLQMIYRDHAAALLAFAGHFTGVEAAEDAVQETFLRTWRALPQLQLDPRPLRPWLIQVLRRVLIDVHRGDRARPATATASPDTVENALLEHAVDGGYDRLDERWRLDQALHRLSPSQQQVVVDIYYFDMPIDSVAAELGIPSGTVRSRLHYALRRLRQNLIPA